MAVVLRKKIVGSDMINKTGVETKEKLVKHNHPRLRIKEINENCPPPPPPPRQKQFVWAPASKTLGGSQELIPLISLVNLK
jgi:hypothetical protein